MTEMTNSPEEPETEAIPARKVTWKVRGSGDTRTLVLNTDDTGDIPILFGNAAMGPGLQRTLIAELNHHLTSGEQATLNLGAIMAALKKV